MNQIWSVWITITGDPRTGDTMNVYETEARNRTEAIAFACMRHGIEHGEPMPGARVKIEAS